MTRIHTLLVLVSMFAMVGNALLPANAQTLVVLHNFNDGTIANDGFDPEAALVQAGDGTFYGTTQFGGSAGAGTVFKVTIAGVATILHNFEGGTVAHDGNAPAAALIQGADGNFYGTTLYGGAAGKGTVFKMTPLGGVTILHSFGDGTVTNDGTYPEAVLIQAKDGSFYGTTGAGGRALSSDPEHNGYGTVFKITSAGVLTILHSFGDGTVAHDGAYPQAALLLGIDGSLYGTTYYGGSTVATDPAQDGFGTAFKITTAGVLTVLHSFGDGTVANDGTGPAAGFVQTLDGTLFGTTEYGGVGGSGSLSHGTVYRMTTNGTVTILHRFNDGTVAGDGNEPEAPLILGSDGNFYGTTTEGGTTVASDPTLLGYGAAFMMTPAGAVTILHEFSDGSVPGDGIDCEGALILGSDGNLYGTTAAGGTGGGSAFQLTGPGPAPLWTARDVAAVADGTARILWTNRFGDAGEWVVNASNVLTAMGPVYGPYTGWSPQDITAAADGTSRILWNRYDGATGVWALNQAGVETSMSPTYGPFSGWKAVDLATAPNGTSRLMWRYTGGQAGILSLSATGNEIIVGRNYGPYTGWTATAVGAAGDGTARMLWTRSDGAMGLWTMNASDLQQSVGPIYGPYSDSHGTWAATDLSTSGDGTSTVLWKRSDGAIGVWTFSAGNTQMIVGAVYGPYSGFVAAALDAANDKARVLWVRSDRAAGLWSFGGSDLESTIGPVYGPF